MTDAVREMTAGESFPLKASRSIMSALTRFPTSLSAMRRRTFSGGIGTSRTMSKRLISAGSIPPSVFVSQKVGTGAISTSLLSSALFDRFGPPKIVNTAPSLMMSSDSSITRSVFSDDR